MPASAATYRRLLAFALAFGSASLSLSQAHAPRSLLLSANDDLLRNQIQHIERSAASLHAIPQAVISPDGTRFAYVVADSGKDSGQELLVGSIAEPELAGRLLLAGKNDKHKCRDADPAWSPDGTKLAFLSDCASLNQMQLAVADVNQSGSLLSSTAKRLTNVVGYLSRPRWSPDGKAIAFLFVDHATRTPSPLAAGNLQTGVIDDLQQLECQRVVLFDLATGTLRSLTPPALTIFEFEWAPDSRRIAYTAAPPPGDDNWYIAQLYMQSISEAEGRSIYKPEFQIALPRWSPDGNGIAFIAGLMSDEGATGGEIYLLPISGGEPRNLTPDRNSSPVWFQFTSSNSLLFTEYRGGSVAASTLDLHDGKTDTLWEAGESIHASSDDSSLSLVSKSLVSKSLINKSTIKTSLTSESANNPAKNSASAEAVVVRESWTQPAEVWAGSVGKWKQLTHLNQGADAGSVGEGDPARPLGPVTGNHTSQMRVEDMTWHNDGFNIQGWLLFPQSYDPAKKYPMLVSIHGGPAWIQVPSVASMDFQITSFTHLGYFVFLPNPRGSFGQGEKFTRANRRDFGFGDVSDVVSGVDSVTAKYSVDAHRVGIIGWSYGASTAMMAVARSDRFRAAVAGAGASNLFSYYGQNQIDKWMHFYYGASAYDDPAAYMRTSAISYVKQVKAPTLLVVGERDEEAPPPQSFEFWHALKELGTPTQLVVYPEEGHSFEKYENRIDLIDRVANWFAKYMPETEAEEPPQHK